MLYKIQLVVFLMEPSSRIQSKQDDEGVSTLNGCRPLHVDLNVNPNPSEVGQVYPLHHQQIFEHLTVISTQRLLVRNRRGWEEALWNKINEEIEMSNKECISVPRA